MKETKGNSIRCCLIEGENLQESLSCAIQDGEVLAELGKWRNFAMPLHTGPLAALLIISSYATVLGLFLLIRKIGFKFSCSTLTNKDFAL